MSGLQIATHLAERYFKDQVDKGGNPYMEHLYYVSSRGRNETEKIVGMLHDILEDTSLTESDLISFGISEPLVKKIALLTRDKSISYPDYIDHLLESRDEEVIYVKKIDMENNMDLRRISSVTPKDIERVEKKYKPNYQKICKALEELQAV